MFELAHLLRVEELDLAMLVDPGFPLLNELLGPGGHVLVLLSQILGCLQFALQLLVSVNDLIDVIFPHFLLNLVVPHLLVSASALGPDLEQMMARSVGSCTEQGELNRTHNR